MDDFYKEKKWIRLRERILRRDGYQCQISKRIGKLRPADTVHHIFPLSEFPDYRFAPWNLISLSSEQHGRMHDRHTDKLTAAGAELLRRTARQQGIDIPERYA